MRAIFLGTPDFALPSLEKLRTICDVVAVVCQPDRAKDRKGRFISPPVKQYAESLGLPVYQFEKIRMDGVEILKSFAPDIMVTCAYGQILSQEILDIPAFGVVNVHGSLLPKYRGSSPLQWSLINGENITGITIMKTALGMDTGDILSQKVIDIPSDMYLDELYKTASELGADLLIETLPKYFSGEITPVSQDESAATKCTMLKKEHYLIDWNLPNYVIRNKIRGMGFGFTFYNGEMLKIYKLDLSDTSGEAGRIEVTKNKIAVYCGIGAVVLTDLQLQNRKRMAVSDFLNGVKMQTGEVFRS